MKTMVKMSPDIRELEQLASGFETRLDEIKASLASKRIDWYPYYTLSAFEVLDRVLTGPRRHLLDLASGDPILDLGCGDGAMSFLFESLGCDVTAIDNPFTNHNDMQGFKHLHAALNSSVKFHNADLDSQFQLPRDVFGLALVLGVLYHLKNPYYLLETLAAHARYCLLSTRIAQRTPSGLSFKDEALAYFLAPREANNDITNYWIFSETSLLRLLDRTGWNVLDFKTFGPRDSEPARLDRDERAYCLLESRVCARHSIELLEGWHAIEKNCYRWTEPQFSILLKRPHLLEHGVLRFDFMLQFPGPVTLAATAGGVSVPPATFDGEGEHSYTIRLPREVLTGDPVRVDFSIDKWKTPDPPDIRKLGLVVTFWKPGLDFPDPILPFVLG
jgi:2-polyprenyl-3-methyl-5-hydroxy-6-metoxy-1,4-benzoquinol methylase